MTRASITVDNGTLEAVKAALREGESMEQFIDLAIHQATSRRQAKAEFLSRAIAAGERARLTGEYRDSESVLAELEGIVRAKEAAKNRT